MKERNKKKLRPWYRKIWGIIIIILISLIILAAVSASFYIIKEVQNIRSGQNQKNQQTEIDKITAAIDGRGENYSLGPADAPVKIVVFSDYACPYCQQSAPIVRSLAKKYGDKIRITMRDYPIHENAVILALASHCAGEQGHFWEAYDLIFARQNIFLPLSETEALPKLNEMAAEMKLDTEKFASCLSQKKYLYRLNDDFTDAELLGAGGTPTWFINRYKITGFYPEENFISMIDGLLAQKDISPQKSEQ